MTVIIIRRSQLTPQLGLICWNWIACDHSSFYYSEGVCGRERRIERERETGRERVESRW